VSRNILTSSPPLPPPALPLYLQVLNGGKAPGFTAESLAPAVNPALGSFARSSPFMQQPIFNSYHW